MAGGCRKVWWSFFGSETLMSFMVSVFCEETNFMSKNTCLYVLPFLLFTGTLYDPNVLLFVVCVGSYQQLCVIEGLCR